MEFCDKSLKEIMREINFNSHFQNRETLTPIGFYIASEIFIEILEGVNFLHENYIIHRNLNPSIILLKQIENYDKFIKICGFGLVTLHEYDEQSHSFDKGTPKYMAPEVVNSRSYDTKADIYSLGVILEELFMIDIYE